MKVYNFKEVKEILKANGFVLVRKKDSHYMYRHPKHKRLLTINNKPNRMIWQRLIKEFDIDLDL